MALSPLGTDSRAAETTAAVTSISLAVPAAPSEEQVLKMLGEKLEEERKKAMQPAPPAPMSMFGQPQAQQQRCVWPGDTWNVLDPMGWICGMQDGDQKQELDVSCTVLRDLIQR